jgi:hypothetical protein
MKCVKRGTTTTIVDPAATDNHFDGEKRLFLGSTDRILLANRLPGLLTKPRTADSTARPPERRHGKIMSDSQSYLNRFELKVF